MILNEFDDAKHFRKCFAQEKHPQTAPSYTVLTNFIIVMCKSRKCCFFLHLAVFDLSKGGLCQKFSHIAKFVPE